MTFAYWTHIPYTISFNVVFAINCTGYVMDNSNNDNFTFNSYHHFSYTAHSNNTYFYLARSARNSSKNIIITEETNVYGTVLILGI